MFTYVSHSRANMTPTAVESTLIAPSTMMITINEALGTAGIASPPTLVRILQDDTT